MINWQYFAKIFTRNYEKKQHLEHQIFNEMIVDPVTQSQDCRIFDWN